MRGQCDKRLSHLVGEDTESAADELLQLRSVAAALRRQLVREKQQLAAAIDRKREFEALLQRERQKLYKLQETRRSVPQLLLLLPLQLLLLLLLGSCCSGRAAAALAGAATLAYVAAGTSAVYVQLEMERIGAHRDLQHYQEELLFLQQQVATAEADLKALADTADATRVLQHQQLQQLQNLDSDRR